jgi:type 1 glutamine amidotransferase
VNPTEAPDSLGQFDAVIFLSTTGDIFDAAQKEAFQKYIQSGKGYVGIHAASDTEYGWPWYGALVGGYFSSHPNVQNAEIQVLDHEHPSTRHLPQVWFHRDEWYDFKDVKQGLNILMNLDEQSYEGGKMGKFHPIAWFQEYDGGRSFYTGLGHTDESFDSELFQKHILGGLYYVLQLK